MPTLSGDNLPGTQALCQTTSPRFASALLVTALIWEFSILLLKASSRLFWYDELLTLHVSNLHPFSLLWKALQAGVDGTFAPG
jgi:hypothetical protein